MAISDTQKTDYLFKKLGFGITKTDTNANKAAANESIPSPLLLRGDKVWQQASSIPATKPGSSATPVTVYTGATTVECTADITASTNRTWKTGLTDWIPPEFGSTYLVNVYVHTASDAGNAESISNKVFITGSGNDDEWFFDYQSGVLHFIGDNLPNGVNFSGKSVYIAGARYTGVFGVGSAPGEEASLGNLTISNVTITSTTPADNIILDAEDGVVVIAGTKGFDIPTGTTSDRPTSPDTGTFRYNTSTSELEIWNGTAWQGFDQGSSTITSETFDGDGSTTTFTLSAEATTNTVFVNLNGVLQTPTTAYSVSGTTLTFTEAPATGDKIEVRKVALTESVSALTNATGNAYIQTNDSGTVDIVGSEVTLTGILQAPQATKASNATGTTGQISWDADYIYVCTATNTWKRVALTGSY